MANALKQTIADIRTQCLTVPGIAYCAMFNNQIKNEIAGKTFDFPKPAILIEIQNPMSGVQLLGTRVSINEGVVIRLSIVYEQLNAIATDESGTGMDENLDVYDLRDALLKVMKGFKPSQCSQLQYCEESQDYDHGNIYVYGVSFKTAYVDTNANVDDSYIYNTPPINLDLAVSIIDGTSDPIVSGGYLWKVCRVDVEIVESDPTGNQTLDNGAIIAAQYVLNEDGTLTVGYLGSVTGINVLAGFYIDGGLIQGAIWIAATNKFDNSANGGLLVGNRISFNASLPYGIA